MRDEHLIEGIFVYQHSGVGTQGASPKPRPNMNSKLPFHKNVNTKSMNPKDNT